MPDATTARTAEQELFSVTGCATNKDQLGLYIFACKPLFPIHFLDLNSPPLNERQVIPLRLPKYQVQKPATPDVYSQFADSRRSLSQLFFQFMQLGRKIGSTGKVDKTCVAYS